MRLLNFASIPVLVAATVLSACVQMPTERAEVVDMRPQLSFAVDEADSRLHSAVVYVNGQQVGVVGQFLRGKAALKVLPGTNVVKVVDGGVTLIEQRLYMADGVSRSLNFK